MIYDLCKDLLVSVASKYADDTKNTAKIENTDDSKNFQNELDELEYNAASIVQPLKQKF